MANFVLVLYLDSRPLAGGALCVHGRVGCPLAFARITDNLLVELEFLERASVHLLERDLDNVLKVGRACGGTASPDG